MRFENIHYATFFIFVPFLLYFFYWVGKKRHQDLERLGTSPLVEKLLTNFRPWEHKLRAALLLLGVTFLLIALLGPQWGFHWETVTHRGVDIIVAVDTSKSMLAEDIRPNRLERAKLLIEDLVNQLEGDRVGLITFAGTSFLQVPLTIDYNSFMQSVQSLSSETMPQGGTAIGEAMDNAITAFDNVAAQNKVLLIITDGENHEGNPIVLAKQAKEAGVQVITVGMGTTTGELIPVTQDGRRQFLKDEQGNVVKSRLEERLLKELSVAASGVYLSGSDLTGLNSLYDQFIGKLKKSDYNTTKKKVFHSRYQIFLLAGILFLGAEMLVGLKRRVKA